MRGVTSLPVVCNVTKPAHPRRPRAPQMRGLGPSLGACGAGGAVRSCSCGEGSAKADGVGCSGVSSRIKKGPADTCCIEESADAREVPSPMVSTGIAAMMPKVGRASMTLAHNTPQCRPERYPVALESF